jgi:FKBP-type peptidyl-prolyl cis-trans isomerase SlyD
MQITNNSVVSLSYILKQDDANGAVIEVAKDTEPLVFIYGAGNMIPKFEENLGALKTGDNFEFTLASFEAYGDLEQDAIIDLDKEIFSVDGVVDEEMLAIGNMIPMRDNEGHMLQGKVVSVSDHSVKMDFNHPMAGQNLHFTGKILSVREATADELSHGHVHGDGGHHH